MKSYAVGELKSHFSEVLEYVKNGEKVGILFGKNKKTIAMIVPINQKGDVKRKIGLLDGKVKISFDKDFSITEEEFLNI
ncbi:prevent-host-death protein [Leptospira sp. 2 VSF19]|uniref:Prevent-host-death protein n=1 Tax=Leptospira soteropolitanensis TaxID=2950025 RepID=A0AAW5VHP8_9LEPT|nr:prevent-host-death protein [Leptospira soteropolitanensis]MCW7494721.1 prevent-host-death protein [Leptospira soteropolitanensis]MCW7502288.1 prevent-host-death protein [Leptospira soteropolitanensis]MCW7524550.1 prevent-host-death protein [Leptospira soteropolitanensis]MCW7528420.1 prevent-host-death protein [Leptospira soteropolitanensis]MCW7532233.1 prevent-host-death protein [Leptospira soteropolitanensis]